MPVRAEMTGKLDLRWQDFCFPGVYGEKAVLRRKWPKRAGKESRGGEAEAARKPSPVRAAGGKRAAG